MHVKFGDETKETITLKSYYICKKKELTIIDFKPQTSPSDCIFEEDKILHISDFVNYKYVLFVRKPLGTENVVIFNDMFTPLILSHKHNNRAAINHLLDMSQKQTCHYETYSMVFTASKLWNDILRKYWSTSKMLSEQK